ncbi:hypothetical protein QJS66_13040 [Kocuria rhizophila]|nr:hypothetical protein QJS66_13040 [Kocuria rhizophila]
MPLTRNAAPSKAQRAQRPDQGPADDVPGALPRATVWCSRASPRNAGHVRGAGAEAIRLARGRGPAVRANAGGGVSMVNG